MLAHTDAPAARIAEKAIDETIERVTRSVGDPEFGAVHFRRLLDRLMLIVEIGVLLRDGTDRGAAAAGLLASLSLDPSYRADDDPGFLHRVDAILAAESENGDQ